MKLEPLQKSCDSQRAVPFRDVDLVLSVDPETNERLSWTLSSAATLFLKLDCDKNTHHEILCPDFHLS